MYKYPSIAGTSGRWSEASVGHWSPPRPWAFQPLLQRSAVDAGAERLATAWDTTAPSREYWASRTMHGHTIRTAAGLSSNKWRWWMMALWRTSDPSRLAANWRRPALIKWTGWTFAVALQWWRPGAYWWGCVLRLPYTLRDEKMFVHNFSVRFLC